MRELELDLDSFEGPFDLLLSLVLREELPLAELDLAQIVVAFVSRLAERDELDLEACGEFLVLFASLLELRRAASSPRRRPSSLSSGPRRRPRSWRGGSPSTVGRRRRPSGSPSASPSRATSASGRHRSR